ncbi:MAG: hypothetical protein KAU27_04730 [Desulfuromonadales bacterium]|nr:hypothetical protein [Desulfuromonadales bacterium]
MNERTPLLREQGIAGSNPVIPTIFFFKFHRLRIPNTQANTENKSVYGTSTVCRRFFFV